MPKQNEKSCCVTVNNLIKTCHKIAREKGWWDKERSGGEVIALMHSELSEALEAMRNSHPKEALAEELADCCIRIFDYCGEKKIDLEKALLKKIEKNKGRPYRHGKVF
ncbi:MAG: MazG nucleotide pyrophosphohydrolase domain-containing protein [Candidatus Omnitrophica bacterium]|nr:MazG nucleotide pyrophosphohydrolase domain-containing protein [Candidatus Omnitrophota bacterium]